MALSSFAQREAAGSVAGPEQTVSLLPFASTTLRELPEPLSVAYPQPVAGSR